MYNTYFKPNNLKFLKPLSWQIRLIFVLVLLNCFTLSYADTWSNSQALNTTANLTNSDDYDPHIKTDGNGNWIAVWASDNTMGETIGADKDIFVSRSTNNGVTWTPAAVLNSNARNDSGQDKDPKISTDSKGNWLVVWQSEDTLNNSVGVDSDILVARSINNGASWTAPMALNSNAGSDSESDQLPEITTDKKGNWVVVWHSKNSLGSTIGTDWDILVSRSTNNGISWTAQAALNSNAATDTGGDYEPQISTDGNSNWVTIWQSSENLGGNIGTDNDILVSRSSDNGVTWTAPAALNSNAETDTTVDLYPALNNDANGNWVAVWTSSDNLGGTIGNDFDIFVSSSNDNGASWSEVSALNSHAVNLTGSDAFPHITSDGSGNWVAAWVTTDSLGETIGNDHDILVSRSTDNGVSWSAVSILNTNADSDSGYDYFPIITTDGNGNWVAVWRSDDSLSGTVGLDNDILISRSSDNGINWSNPTVVSTNETINTFVDNDRDPAVATDKTGNWLVVWSSDEDLDNGIGSDDDILVSRSTNNGNSWSVPAALNSNAGSDSDNDDNPQIATDGNGKWLAVWQSGDSLGSTIGTDHDILVSHSSDNGNSWSAPAILNSNAGSDTGNDYYPQIATDTSGNWLVVWESYDSLGNTIGTDSDILFSHSSNNGNSWSAPAALNSAAGGDVDNDSGPTITTDANGNWLVVWASRNSLGDTIGTDSDILLSRSTNNGNSWSAQTALNSNAGSDTENDYAPVVATDGNDNWIAVWGSEESLGSTIGNDYDILVARSINNGDSWTAPAALNSNAASDSETDEKPHIQTDGNGNWIVAWISEDTLGDTIGWDADILVSNSSDNGSSWSSVAVLNSGAENDSDDDLNPKLASDGNGNWLTVWQSGDSLGNTIGDDDDILYSRISTNNPPSQNINTGATLVKGGTAPIFSTQLDFNDDETADSGISYTITTNVSNGNLKRNNIILNINDSFTQDDINNNRITYTHDNSNAGNDSFGFSVSNDVGGQTTGHSFNFTINLYTINTNISKGGGLARVDNPDGSLTFTISANTDYELNYISGCNGTLNGTTYTTEVLTGDCSITVDFIFNYTSTGFGHTCFKDNAKKVKCWAR